ncbi:KR domain-containing protein [Hirsutella rhossiliensis]|uniref:KR domain-containing protein n=1 Tax=Hirsutella rhossiliensis TaxID=111463 RepID=A0A9P8SNG8_9HYPO|nr:KR domain-containing protein [Hirsutella rhossiliensis]KAH0967865.1 KR domain-containing protein [Hirsutella rhossiliensis]
MAMDIGCLSTRKVVPGNLVTRTPDGLSLEEAATLPIVYATDIHAVINLGRLKKGQSILVHSACGGAGLAALELCTAPEAEIYVTCVARCGSMMEIGKCDILGHGALALNPFNENRTFHGIGLAGLRQDNPAQVQELMEQCVSYHKQGIIKPIQPIRVLQASQVAEAFRYMQNGLHLGKVLIRLSGEARKLPCTKLRRGPTLSSIGGVLQMAMVLIDCPFQQLGHDAWGSVQNPKVKGTWNLHRALLGTKLDFFVLFSSVAAVWGQPGQANYASANTFLHSFAQYRHSLDLPCSVIDIGVMEGVGYVSQNPAVLKQLRLMGAHTLQEQELLDAMGTSVERGLPWHKASAGHHGGSSNPSQVTIGLRSCRPLCEPSNRVPWKRDIRMSLYRQVESTTVVSSDAGNRRLQDFLSMAEGTPGVLSDEASIKLVTWEIARTLCGFLLQPEENLDITRSLASMGIDSLERWNDQANSQ